jgi:hypothetical protein
MSRVHRRILLAAAAWTLYVWITRAFILAGDDDASTSFKVVHFVLAGVSVAFGLATGWIALTAGRRARAEEPAPAGEADGSRPLAAPRAGR